MSELSNLNGRSQRMRHALLLTSSVLAVAACMIPFEAVAATENDAPTVWIELGGQLERVGADRSQFSPAFFDTIAANGLVSPLSIDRLPRFTTGLEGRISFVPKETDWTFSGSVRYGRVDSRKFLHQQPPAQVSRFPFGTKYRTKTAVARYAETKSSNDTSHLIVDFQAGKDVGLGILGQQSSSNISFGVRFAQFSEKQAATFRARPDVQLINEPVFGGKYHIPLSFYHRYAASAERNASFHGIGPSITWNSSVQVAGDVNKANITLDWSVNASVLFGRQKAITHHQSSGFYHYYLPEGSTPTVVQFPTNHGTSHRSRSVMVPNVGGSIGGSFRYANAKLSFGYRADLFFGAMDSGLDSAKRSNTNFYGPFATISVGLGG